MHCDQQFDPDQPWMSSCWVRTGTKSFQGMPKFGTKSWYRQRNYNPMLQALDIESSERGEKIGEYVVQSLILAAFNSTSGASRDTEEFMDATGKAKTRVRGLQADLTPESVLFWRGQCEMFRVQRS